MNNRSFNVEAIAQHIADWLSDYRKRSSTNGFVVGVSGGVDSAVTSTLCAMTGAPVVCVQMPIHQHPDQLARASEHIKQLRECFANVKEEWLELSEAFDHFEKAMPEVPVDHKELALANTRARLRMSALYYLAASHGMLVAGTGNKVEDFGVGFYTKYGDGGVDISPIADLIKTEVFLLAEYLLVPNSILKAAPTDGLWGDDRGDEDQLGASYPELEWAMKHLEEGDGTEGLSKREMEVLEIYTRLNRANQHKMNPIPVCLIPEDWKYSIPDRIETRP